MKKEEKWFKNYFYAKKYYLEHGNLFIPATYETKDEFGNVIKLGYWLVNQKASYRKNVLEQKRIELLEEIGVNWNINKKTKITRKWLESYNLAKKYYNEHDNLLIPYDYIDKDTNFNLGCWIYKQQKDFINGNYDELKKELLDSIGIVWIQKGDKLKNKWMKNYFYAKKYYLENGNLRIAFDYKIKDEFGNIIHLGNWINTQRRAYKHDGYRNISKEQIDLLNSINMIWTFRDNKELIRNKWYDIYLLAENYYLKYKDTLYIDDNVIINNNNGTFNLSSWLKEQRCNRRLNKLDDDQIKLLDSINMVWDKNDLYKIKEYLKKDSKNYEDNLWNNYYLVLKKYKSVYNNICIPKNYKYVEEDTNKVYYLYNWLNLQKEFVLRGIGLKENRLELLNKLDINWLSFDDNKYVDSNIDDFNKVYLNYKK